MVVDISQVPACRAMCRATRVAADFLDFIAFCRCSTGVALHPLKILVSHLPPPLCREVSHRNLGLKRCCATRGCRSYSCGCRATLCNYGGRSILGCSFFAYNWKLPAYSGAFILTVDNFAFLLTVGAFLLTTLAFCLQLELFCLQWESASNKGLKGL